MWYRFAGVDILMERPVLSFFPKSPPRLVKNFLGLQPHIRRQFTRARESLCPGLAISKQRLMRWGSVTSRVGGCLLNFAAREISGQQLMEVGRRIYNVEKGFNTFHAGFTRKDDYPPAIYMKEPIKTGMYQGELITHEGHEKMLDEFYDANGWDKKTSWPTYETLEILGLPEVSKKLREKSL